MKKPIVSIIIPYYKKIKYFKKTYLSVLNQNFKNFEIIIIYDDENLSDLTKLKKIIKKKKNVKIIINKKNLGAGQSRNKGIAVAKGDFLAFIDSDDVWKKNKLKQQIKFMKKNNYFLTHTSYNIINNKNNILSKRRAATKLNYKNLLESCDIGLSTVMINKKKIKKIKFGYTKTKEDYSLWLKLTKNFPFYGLNQNLTYWTKSNNSLSNSTFQKLIDAFRIYYFQEKFSIMSSIIRTFLLSLNFINKSYLK